MAVLHWLSYVGGLAGFLFVTLSLASGLLWLAELIEEHSRYAKTIGMRAIYAIIALHIILIFTDSLPILPTLLSISAHLVYLSNFSSSWPYISLTSLRFIASCLLVVADHFTWFFHFTAKANEAKRYRQPKYRYGSAAYNDGPAFMDVAAFFAICVWFVPLFLFLSLSANDNALPSFDSTSSTPSSPAHPGHIDLSTPVEGAPLHRQLRARTSTSLVKAALAPLLAVMPRIGGSRRKNDEGLIAPRTPVRGSPLHSPVPMAQTGSYFPWGDDGTPKHGSKPLPNLGFDHLKRGKTPPPPKRVVSDAQIYHSMNPRGLATRNGIPVGTAYVPEASREKTQDANGDSDEPKMSLGPQGDGGANAVSEVIDSNGPLRRRKAD